MSTCIFQDLLWSGFRSLAGFLGVQTHKAVTQPVELGYRISVFFIGLQKSIRYLIFLHTTLWWRTDKKILKKFSYNSIFYQTNWAKAVQLSVWFFPFIWSIFSDLDLKHAQYVKNKQFITPGVLSPKAFRTCPRKICCILFQDRYFGKQIGFIVKKCTSYSSEVKWLYMLQLYVYCTWFIQQLR